jgi:uncharacterized protein YjiS (DUF1127 family)
MRSVADARPRSTVAAGLLAPVYAVMRELRMRRDAHLLAQMDDHQLSDIGIVRTQIEDAVRSGRVSPLAQSF